MENRSAWIIAGAAVVAASIVVAGIWFFGYRTDAACNKFRDAVQRVLGGIPDAELHNLLEQRTYSMGRVSTDCEYVEKPEGCYPP